MYDVETGLYYLRSRYYDPDWGRFLNSDSLVTGNMFLYCYNSTTYFVDSEGKMPVPILNGLSGIYNSGLLMAEDISVLTILLNGGNIFNGFHEVAQLNAAKYIFDTTGVAPTLEYGLSNGKEADIMAMNMLWEIKPVTQSGLDQLNGYLEVSGMQPGTPISFDGIPIIENIYMGLRPKQKEPGVIEYYFYRQHDGKKEQLDSTTVRDRINAVETFGIAVITILLGATLVEDIITGGVGMVDDIPSILLALPFVKPAFGF